MNIFDLRGPDFLLVYAFFSLFVVLSLWFYRRYAEQGDPPKLDLSDPYLIAYLRGGENEALRLAVLSLTDRGLLIVNDDKIRRSESASRIDARSPIEDAVLRKTASFTNAASLFKDETFKAVCAPYREKLILAGLMPDADIKRDRLLRYGLALAALGGLAGVKIAVGLERERPVGFLVALTLIALATAAVVSFPRLTASGREAIKNIQSIYGGLKDRAREIQPGVATNEAMYCAAIFGAGVLGASEYGYFKRLFPQSGSSSCGSSCGSSGGDGGGGGGGCGGGGCGGCGS